MYRLVIRDLLERQKKVGHLPAIPHLSDIALLIPLLPAIQFGL